MGRTELMILVLAICVIQGQVRIFLNHPKA